MKRVENLIIGAGPAGLAVAGRMRKASLDFTLLERTDKVGYAWHNHYDRLHLHTVKQYSNLPHLPFPDHYPLYVPKQQVAEYLEQYAAHFNIQPIFNREVISIKKMENHKWLVGTKTGESYQTTRVIIGTGMNRLMNVPTFKGQEAFIGEITHSRKYKNAEPYRGKKVLVIGMGNTGAELALDLCENDAETYLSVRSPVSIVPRDRNGQPIQVISKKLAKIPFNLGEWIGNIIRRRHYGDLSAYGLQQLTDPPVKILRTTGQSPVIDIGTIDAIKAGKIKVLGNIERFHKTGVAFKDGQSIDFDSIILATGYRSKVEDFLERGEEALDDYGLPQPEIGVGYHQNIFFNGFDNYKLGGALGTIFNDSKTIVDYISEQA
ncbi:MAG: flavin-containing monooxygenase [Saprospiraceae bacterium]